MFERSGNLVRRRSTSDINLKAPVSKELRGEALLSKHLPNRYRRFE